jgi:hypothetical protein
MNGLASVVQEEQWFDASVCTAEVRAAVKSVQVAQDLHMIDLFSASGNGACTFTAAGYQSMVADILRDRRHDTSTKAAFFSYTIVVLPACSKRLDTRRPTLQPLWIVYRHRCIDERLRIRWATRTRRM